MTNVNIACSFDGFNRDPFSSETKEWTVLSRFYLYGRNFGWRIILLHGVVDGCCTCGDPRCDSPGKHPMFSNWQETGTADGKVLEGWRQNYPSANFGVMTGSESNLFVLDIEPDNGGNETLANLGIAEDDLQWGLELKTGGGNRHYYFTLPVDLVLPRIKTLAPGVSIKCEGDFVVGPGSTHVNGNKYRWITAMGFFMYPPEEIPEKLLDLLRTRSNSMDPAA